LVPSFHGSDDFVWVGCPCKGFGVFVGFGHEAIDGGLEINERVEDAAFEPSAGQGGEEALDGVEPGGRCRREVEDPSGMTYEPGTDLGLLVGGVVVEDGMDDLTGGHLALDGVEEADQLLVAVALHVVADHGAVEDVKGSE